MGSSAPEMPTLAPLRIPRLGDDRLAALAAVGDARAFEALYDRHHGAPLRLLPPHARQPRGGRGRPPADLPARTPGAGRAWRTRGAAALALHDRAQLLPHH